MRSSTKTTPPKRDSTPFRHRHEVAEGGERDADLLIKQRRRQQHGGGKLAASGKGKVEERGPASDKPPETGGSDRQSVCSSAFECAAAT